MIPFFLYLWLNGCPPRVPAPLFFLGPQFGGFFFSPSPPCKMTISPSPFAKAGVAFMKSWIILFFPVFSGVTPPFLTVTKRISSEPLTRENSLLSPPFYDSVLPPNQEGHCNPSFYFAFRVFFSFVQKITPSLL